jgi:5,10-methenyltetrahydrofolate synthetase
MKQHNLPSSIPCRTTPAAAGTRSLLRRRLLAERASLPAALREAHDRAIARRLLDWLVADGWPPGTIALWWPLAGEPDPRPVFDELLARGWQVALPRVHARDRPLAFGRWHRGIGMVEEAHRVQVPAPFEAVRPSLVVAPCLGFDPAGWRLGYGGGYYDRTLAELDVPAAGVGYDCCEVALMPEPHDRRLQVILTESRLLRCDRAGPPPGAAGTTPPPPAAAGPPRN